MARRSTLMLVDVPNINSSFWNRHIIHPNWKALYAWGATLAAGTSSEFIARAYLNLVEDTTSQIAQSRRRQIKQLNQAGFEICAAMKVVSEDDIDQDMLIDLTAFRQDKTLVKVIIVSHDMRNFADAVTQLEVSEISCSLVGFEADMGRVHDFIAGIPHTFVPVTDIPGFVQARRQLKLPPPPPLVS